jgi:hypothetical protein
MFNVEPQCLPGQSDPPTYIPEIPTTSSGLDTGAIIGIVVGVIVGSVLLIVGGVLFVKRYKKNKVLGDYGVRKGSGDYVKEKGIDIEMQRGSSLEIDGMLMTSDSSTLPTLPWK